MQASKTLTPNIALRNAIEDWCKDHFKTVSRCAIPPRLVLFVIAPNIVI